MGLWSSWSSHKRCRTRSAWNSPSSFLNCYHWLEGESDFYYPPEISRWMAGHALVRKNFIYFKKRGLLQVMLPTISP